MRFKLCSLIFLFITSCTANGDLNTTSEITIQKYSFDFPNSYKKIKKKTFNSYVGEISNDTITISFHYSDHVNRPIKSVEEIFDDEDWKPKVLFEIAAKKKIKDIGNIFFSTLRKATEKDSTIGNGCDYIVKCQYDSLEFEAPIYLPDKMKGIAITIDTVFGQHRETYIPNDPENGITGVFIKTISASRPGSSRQEALSLTTTKLTKSQQQNILRFLSTFRVKSGDD
jgi:hypothetical protein